MADERPELRRVRLPSGRSVSLQDPAGVPGGFWGARPVGGHYIVQRTYPDGSEDTVTGHPVPALKPETLGNRLRLLRQKKGLSLREAAGSVGSSYVHLWQVETGKTGSPGVFLMSRLARLYGTTVEQLMGGLL